MVGMKFLRDLVLEVHVILRYRATLCFGDEGRDRLCVPILVGMIVLADGVIAIDAAAV